MQSFYRCQGYYSHQLTQLYRYFKDEQILLIPMSQLLTHDKTMKSVFSFLGVDATYAVPHEIIFAGGGVKTLPI